MIRRRSCGRRCVLAVGLGAWRLQDRRDAEEASRQARTTASGGGFDPDAMVRAIWDSKVIPYLAAKAGPLPEVVALARANPDEAGRKYGYRAKEGSEPWTFVVKIEGRIVAAETASRARRRSASTPTATARSPRSSRSARRCAARRLRDALDFVSFNDFKNQIDYAQFGKAFNTYVVQHGSVAICRATRWSAATSRCWAPSRSRRAISRRW